MKKSLLFLFLFSFTLTGGEKENPPIYIAFLWHMHQPIYWPYENLLETDNNGRFPYSVTDIHNQRLGPYNSWPKDAVQSGIDAGLPHLGAQVSFSGSLVENLNNLEAGGNGNFQNWKSHWNYIKTQTTSLGNPRLDMVGFGYHHPLMGLIDYSDIRNQIQAHKEIFSSNFSGNYSRGIFPPENAFTPEMIPALADEGIEWALIDNIHFERTCEGYPWASEGGLYEPNGSDILNPNPGDWIQLNNLWAPTKVSAAWSSKPKWIEYADPETGGVTRIIGVPADRYLGNEDGRGGFGALQYESVMSQFETYNTDSEHPILIVLHHDGDNYGGGSESYYHSNFQNFVNWLQSNPSRFVCTTIQDYLDMFPPAQDDVIHVENGSWSGADNGDPEFMKWLGAPGDNGYSPDRNSWAVVTAAKNFVEQAEQINPNANDTKEARRYYMNSQTSCYWYWDGSLNGIWDSNPTRACNYVFQHAGNITGTDNTGPSIFHPQREPYNPGGTEWGVSQSSDFMVWSYVFDRAGLKTVKLKYREDLDGVNSMDNHQNETYAGGSDVGSWQEIDMTEWDIASQTAPTPMYKAKQYQAEITGINDKLLDYYIEAVDSNNNVSKSIIKHVWVGDYSGGGGTSGVSWEPAQPSNDDMITITIAGATIGGKLHWGVNGWQTPDEVYWPAGTEFFNGSGPAVETPFNGPDTSGNLTLQIGPFNNAAQIVNNVTFVIHYDDDTWDNNGGLDYQIVFNNTPSGFEMDGAVDSTASLISTNNGLDLYLGWQNPLLYVATQSAASLGDDIFILISDNPDEMVAAPWAKAGETGDWSAYLANESTNGWSGWFDNNSTADNAAGDYLEGYINLEEEFGAVPLNIYIAVGRYQTDDGGALNGQTPAGNGDGNIDTGEFYLHEFGSGGTITVPVNVDAGWNIISVPVDAEDMSLGSLFPSAVSQAFGFNNGYISFSDLEYGKGYWLKFDDGGALNLTGDEITTGEILLAEGWNLIGPFDEQINVNGINTSPPAIIESNFFGFNAGYFTAQTLDPGKGYWVRASEEGAILTNIIVPGKTNDNSNTADGSLIFTDAAGNRMSLKIFRGDFRLSEYILPPAPPEGIFDIRTTDNMSAINTEGGAAEISLRNVVYPIVLESVGMEIRIKDPVSLSEYSFKDNGRVIISNESVRSLLISSGEIPNNFALEQNYPNPFNPSTKIEFSLPVESDVEFAVYNILGQKVYTYSEKMQTAGYHNLEFNGKALSSGIYIYTISAKGADGSLFSDSRKMLLVK